MCCLLALLIQHFRKDEPPKTSNPPAVRSTTPTLKPEQLRGILINNPPSPTYWNVPLTRPESTLSARSFNKTLSSQSRAPNSIRASSERRLRASSTISRQSLTSVAEMSDGEDKDMSEESQEQLDLAYQLESYSIPEATREPPTSPRPHTPKLAPRTLSRPVSSESLVPSTSYNPGDGLGLGLDQQHVSIENDQSDSQLPQLQRCKSQAPRTFEQVNNQASSSSSQSSQRGDKRQRINCDIIDNAGPKLRRIVTVERARRRSSQPTSALGPSEDTESPATSSPQKKKSILSAKEKLKVLYHRRRSNLELKWHLAPTDYVLATRDDDFSNRCNTMSEGSHNPRYIKWDWSTALNLDPEFDLRSPSHIEDIVGLRPTVKCTGRPRIATFSDITSDASNDPYPSTIGTIPSSVSLLGGRESFFFSLFQAGHKRRREENFGSSISDLMQFEPEAEFYYKVVRGGRFSMQKDAGVARVHKDTKVRIPQILSTPLLGESEASRRQHQDPQSSASVNIREVTADDEPEEDESSEALSANDYGATVQHIDFAGPQITAGQGTQATGSVNNQDNRAGVSLNESPSERYLREARKSLWKKNLSSEDLQELLQQNSK